MLLAGNLSPLQAQAPAVMVDDKGVMRNGASGEELHGFGVNYTVPFAHAYRSAKALGLDPLVQIDRDLHHLSRLGFDLFRVHVWDTEISDTLGNLLYNEHFHAFDYLLHQLASRGFHYVLTPIAFWGNGWPEPDQPTPGFSAKYGKDACLTHPAAIAAQENYLTQFLNHVNPYTGIAYKDDPNLLAVEISNEPHHREAPEQVTAFVQKMVAAVKRSGYTKPVFYNISHSVHLVDAYFEGGIDGGTFQWYPTGLGYQRELPGNILPALDNYDIPFNDRIRAHGGAKLVYEFDAADIGRAHVYPAMARSFREAGIQLATHFAYDPLFLAYANTEYNTHYMNLAYVPQKAIGLMIAGEVFRQWPMYQDAGTYPANNAFGPFFIDEQQDLALLNDGTRFFYSNTTNRAPANLPGLQQIAGVGSSPLVSYDGSGAYFLDKLEDGVWRLEVMPDALLLRNPYGQNSLNKTVARVQWNERTMRISLPDLGESFSVTGLNAGNRASISASNGQVLLSPGAYLITRKGQTTSFTAASVFRNMKLGDFVAPQDGIDQEYVQHQPVELVIGGRDLTVSVLAAAPGGVDRVRLMLTGGQVPMTVDLERRQGCEYQGTIPAGALAAGTMGYYLLVESGGQTRTFPAGQAGLPYDWDFHAREAYPLRVQAGKFPITLFDAQQHRDFLITTRWVRGQELLPVGGSESAYSLTVRELFQQDPENLNGPEIQDFTIKYPFGDRLDGVREGMAGKTTLVLRGGSSDDQSQRVQIALVGANGVAWGKVVTLKPGIHEIGIPVSSLQPVKTVILPRPYPTFLPYYYEAEQPGSLDLSTIEAIQISLGPGSRGEIPADGYHLGLISITLR